MKTNYISTDAIISDCEKYRYSLTRLWDARKPACTFIGLNPSTADAQQDDPTIRRCVGFAKSLDCGKLYMVNLFPYRATSPRKLIELLNKETAENAHEFQGIDDQNIDAIFDAVVKSKYAICGWGNHGKHLAGVVEIIKRACKGRLLALKINQATGEPAHPLYLPADLKPQNYA